jgi:hypothetical protein
MATSFGRAAEFDLPPLGPVGLYWPGHDITFMTLGENDLIGVPWAGPRGRWTAIARESVIASAVDAKRVHAEWERDHAFRYTCLRYILPIFQSRLEDAVLHSDICG